jgi:hypothetical protein
LFGARLLERLEDTRRIPSVRRNDERLCEPLPDEKLVDENFGALFSGEDVGECPPVSVRSLDVMLEANRAACEESAVQETRFFSEFLLRAGRMMQFRRIHQKVSYSSGSPIRRKFRGISVEDSDPGRKRRVRGHAGAGGKGVE